jgi:hypothetical protein
VHSPQPSVGPRLSFLALNKVKPFLVVLGWGTTIAGFVVGAMFQGLLIPQYAGGGDLQPEIIGRGPSELIIFYILIFALSMLASLVLADFAKGLGGFFASYAIAAGLTYFIIALPGYVGAFPVPDVLVTLAVNWTFAAFFPLLFLVGFAATIAGSALAERIVY